MQAPAPDRHPLLIRGQASKLNALKSLIAGLTARPCAANMRPSDGLTVRIYPYRLYFRAGTSIFKLLPSPYIGLAKTAGWQSGHAGDCKSPYVGSIPAPASNISIG